MIAAAIALRKAMAASYIGDSNSESPAAASAVEMDVLQDEGCSTVESGPSGPIGSGSAATPIDPAVVAPAALVAPAATQKPVPIKIGPDENLWTLASDGKLAAVRYLIESGAHGANDSDEFGYTPLHAAASYGHLELAEYLLAKGADPGLVDPDGDGPLHVCESPQVTPPPPQCSAPV